MKEHHLIDALKKINHLNVNITYTGSRSCFLFFTPKLKIKNNITIMGIEILLEVNNISINVITNNNHYIYGIKNKSLVNVIGFLILNHTNKSTNKNTELFLGKLKLFLL